MTTFKDQTNTGGKLKLAEILEIFAAGGEGPAAALHRLRRQFGRPEDAPVG